ncbi:MAG: SDR family oxidoreductase [Chloroflexi bacterium]|nr:SDR family oxidoreductase [Chloroflexota bacterium]
MEIALQGKNALITGGAAGIGRVCAQLLGNSGARVAVCDIDLDGANETVAPLAGGLAVRCDVSDPKQVEDMAQTVLSAFGGVDILVNNAGIISFKRGINGITIEEWDKVLSVNLRGPFLVCRQFVEQMKERRYGRIVNFSSMAARVGGIEVGIHYAASKAGLIAFTKTLAKELGPYGINVNTVAPGFTETTPVKTQLAGREERFIAPIPLGRLGDPMDTAKTVLFLVSSLSDYITGQIIDINGGQYMG